MTSTKPMDAADAGERMLYIGGVRGSLPACGAEYQRYGGSTSGFYLRYEGLNFMLDAGSGIISLGQRIFPGPLHILLSHVHLDHILGLPQFAPLYEPEREIYIYGEDRGGVGIQQQLERVFSPPSWPVQLIQFPAKVHFVRVQAGQPVFIGGMRVDTVRLPHPDTCTGYRIGDVSYMLDCELPEQAPELVRFASGSGLVVMDGGTLPEEFVSGWGHSAWQRCAAFAQQAGIGQVILSHYGRKGTDDALDVLASELPAYCRLARQGDEIPVKKGGAAL